MGSAEQVTNAASAVHEGSPDPATARTTIVRRDVWALEDKQEWHPVIAAYAEAVRIMRGRTVGDPTSWAYQAAMHGSRTADDWLNTCQHGSWFFLPWHRMYLYWFERICRTAIESSPEVDDTTKATWALPYWNYDRGTPTNQIPKTFREEFRPDGSPNPLFVSERDRAMNAGGSMLPPETTASAALAKREFSGPAGFPGATAGFGGPQTGFSHGGRTIGELENTPHGAVHMAVGGLMASFNTAGLDPLFWLHHCNIDRLWEVWLRQTNPARRNPASAAWTTNQVFHFRDDSGADVTQVSGDVLDTEGQLNYIYDQFASPFRRVPTGGDRVDSRGFAAAPDEEPDRPPELVGASEDPVRLTGEVAETTVSVAGPSAFRRQRAEPERVYLNIEEVRADGTPGGPYQVFVNLPDDDETTDDNYNVGLVSLFGAAEASDPDSDHQEGLRYVFDITELYRVLSAAGLWRDDVKVTFKPVRVRMPEGARAAFTQAEPRPEATVTVGRVSVFFR